MRLTQLMIQSLRTGLNDNIVTAKHGQTIASMFKQGLIDEERKLTENGRLVALEYSGLKKQCALLDLPILVIKTDNKRDPEKKALEHYNKHGYRGAYYEFGPIETILKALTLEALSEASHFARDGSEKARADSCTRYLKAQLESALQRDVDMGAFLEAILGTTEKDLRLNCMQVIAHQESHGIHEGMDIDALCEIARVIERENLHVIAEFILQDPYAHCIGWPDLVVSDGNMVQFIEVKTTDKLHASQLRTIPELMKILPQPFSVLQIKDLDK